MSSSIHDDALVDRLKRRLSTILSKKRLVEYFTAKGFDDFQQYVYPPALQDLSTLILELRNKVEVQPFSEKIDPTTGVVMIGWNLFVLGTNRLFLGHSYHNSAQDLKRSYGATSSGLPHDPKKKVGDIVDFIVETLEKNKDGILDPIMVGVNSGMRNVDGYARGMNSSPQPMPTSGIGYEKTRHVN